MRKTIRQMSFETNSSSSHSISLINLKKPDIKKLDVTIDRERFVVLNGVINEFGWGPTEYNDANTKIMYILLYLRDSDFCTDDRDKYYQQLKKCIEQITRKPVEGFKINGQEFNFINYTHGYIDSDSLYFRDEDYPSMMNLFNDPIADINMTSFIFNPENILLIDNDN